MPDFPKKYRVPTAEEDILFEMAASQNIPTKNLNLASALGVGGTTYVSFAAFKFTSPTLDRDVSSHDAQDAGAPTLEISVAVS